MIFQGITIGSELIAWGLTKGAEVGSHLMQKVSKIGLFFFRQTVIFVKIQAYTLYEHTTLLDKTSNNMWKGRQSFQVRKFKLKP